MGNTQLKYVYKTETQNGDLKDLNTLKIYKNNKLIFSGECLNDKREGFGVEYYTNGAIKYSGNWKDDKYHGSGRLHNRDNSIKYSGHFCNGVGI